MVPLADLDVLAVDCQATAASPRGHLLELGWARVAATDAPVRSRLIQLPDGQRIPPAVTRITGISQRTMQDAIDAAAAWSELSADACSVTPLPRPAVAHFAQFERPFLCTLAGGTLPFELACTHQIARRLLPDLPRCGLRALAGYLGRAVGPLRRSGEHVEATAFVWRELIGMLAAEGVSTWSELQRWLACPQPRPRSPRRGWPMPREMRLSAPDAPGVYCFQRGTGDVLYIGKASSLRGRVNSYFRKRHGVSERLLEMLTQVRAMTFTLTPTALEAALLENDEIKRHRPPYNIALADDRRVWFATPDLSECSREVSPRHGAGPFRSAQTLNEFDALAHADRAALGYGSDAPAPALFDAGYQRLCAAHPEMSCARLGAHARLLALGTRLWRDGHRDDVIELADGWTADLVQLALERIALRAALARRRASWLTRLFDAALVWSEPGADGARLIVIENGEIALCCEVERGSVPPVASGARRPVLERHSEFTIARFDRLRVLTTELKRLAAEGGWVALRLGAGRVLSDARLASALAWL